VPDSALRKAAVREYYPNAAPAGALPAQKKLIQSRRLLLQTALKYAANAQNSKPH
jgi:hypothetical protein